MGKKSSRFGCRSEEGVNRSSPDHPTDSLNRLGEVGGAVKHVTYSVLPQNVVTEGFEPSYPCGQQILSLPCMPVPATSPRKFAPAKSLRRVELQAELNHQQPDWKSGALPIELCMYPAPCARDK